MKKLISLVMGIMLLFSFITFTGCKQKQTEEMKAPEMTGQEMQKETQPSGEQAGQEEHDEDNPMQKEQQ
jgi:hypothetical protein